MGVFDLDDKIDNDESQSRRAMRRQLRAIERLGFQTLAVTLVIILIYGASVGQEKVFNIVALLVGSLIAASIVGGLLGFIFGIPRFLRQNDSVPVAGSGGTSSNAQVRSDKVYRAFAGNTNLEEISDWLTKIIVGVGLVQATKIFEMGRSFTTKFGSQANNAAGAEALFVAVCLIGAAGGFLFFYIETRTRVTLLLSDADTAAGGSSAISQSVADASLSTPIRKLDTTFLPASGDQAAATVPTDADKKLLEVSFDDLKTPDDFAAWGAAQARAGNALAAVKSIQEAITRDPGNPRFLSIFADASLLQHDASGAVKALKEARGKSPDQAPELLRKELSTSLYLNPPLSFQNAIEAGRALLDQVPTSKKDAMVQVWMAAAYGQQYEWLQRNAGSEEALATARRNALYFVKQAVALEPNSSSAVRKILVDLFNPSSSEAADNDLSVFRNEKEFLEATGQQPTTMESAIDEAPRRLGEETD